LDSKDDPGLQAIVGVLTSNESVISTITGFETLKEKAYNSSQTKTSNEINELMYHLAVVPRNFLWMDRINKVVSGLNSNSIGSRLRRGLNLMGLSTSSSERITRSKPPSKFFIAAGAMHMKGDSGLPQLFLRQGYQVFNVPIDKLENREKTISCSRFLK
jgi:hypothetical protein